jgi:hypothetical protein
MRLRSFQLFDTSGSTLVAFESDGRFCEPIVAASWLYRLPLLLRSLVQPLSVDENDLLVALSGEVGFCWQLEAELPSLQFRIGRSVAQGSVRLEVPDGQQGWRQVALGADAVDDRLARRLALESAGAVAALWFGARPAIADLASVSADGDRPDWLEVPDMRQSTSRAVEAPPPSAGLAALVTELRQVRLSDALAAAESRVMMGSLAFSAEDDGMVQLQADLERASKTAASLGPIRRLSADEEELLAIAPQTEPARPPLGEALQVWWQAESRAWVPVFVGKLLALALFAGAATGSRTMGKMLPLNLGLLAWAAWGANRLFDRRATGRPLITPLFVRQSDPVGDARAALVAELGCDTVEELDDRNRQREVAEARRERAELALTSMGGAVGGGAAPSDSLSSESIRQTRSRLALSGRSAATVEQELRSMGLEPEALLQAESAAALGDALAPLREAGRALGLWTESEPARELLMPWTAVLRQTLGREVVAVASGPAGAPPLFRDSAGPVSLTPGEAARALTLLRIVMVRAAVSGRKEGALAMMVTAGMLAGAEGAERRQWRKVLAELSPSVQVICLESVG